MTQDRCASLTGAKLPRMCRICVMKLLINLDTHEVMPATEVMMAKAKNNGQHLQLDGWVIGDVEMSGCETTFKLLHPTTNESSGHVDVRVEYRNNIPSFHTYACQEFEFSDSFLECYFPTGIWSLIMVVTALEGYLNKQFGFIPRVRLLLSSALK